MTVARSLAGASITVVTRDAALADRIQRLLPDERTHVLADVPAPTRAGTVPDIPDVVVFDVRSHRFPARELGTIRRQWPTIGVMVVNVSDEREINTWLDLGADDACDSTSASLDSRLHAMARRARAINAEMRVAHGDLVVDPERRHVWCAGRPVDLSSREFALFHCLFHHAPDVVERKLLSSVVWGVAATPSNTVEVHVSYLRRKLATSRMTRIQTVRRVGYALVVRDEPR